MENKTKELKNKIQQLLETRDIAQVLALTTLSMVPVESGAYQPHRQSKKHLQAKARGESHKLFSQIQDYAFSVKNHDFKNAETIASSIPGLLARALEAKETWEKAPDLDPHWRMLTAVIDLDCHLFHSGEKRVTADNGRVFLLDDPSSQGKKLKVRASKPNTVICGVHVSLEFETEIKTLYFASAS